MKRIYMFPFLVFLLYTWNMTAQENTVPLAAGRYQTVDLGAETPCNCSTKTERYYTVYKTIRENDLRDYKMISYKFSLGNTLIPISKLFRALEQDPAVMKISIHEWDYFILFTTPAFDKGSFDVAAKKVFESITEVPADEFFLNQNAELKYMYKNVFGQGN